MSIDKNPENKSTEVVRPERALLEVFFHTAKSNIEYFTSRPEAVLVAYQANLASLGKDLAMADLYEKA